MTDEASVRRAGVFRSRRHRAHEDLRNPAPHAADRPACFRKAAGLCTGEQEIDAHGRIVCACAEVLMAPSPGRVIDTFTDLGLTDEQIGRYFHIPTRCITALRQSA
ncbi:hypothetical protein LAZ29_10370 [Cereibacter sphaeroides]|uniref:hypothetical protein n=1 Tax=Cereibacter sphaeroides TaxID=1063 RepID=UPI001F4067F2|nr:hypothetical protein [Cereibacter sphaeroides]MCE6951335.1 hypothetical protein [Cereibacter sphaeroides]